MSDAIDNGEAYETCPECSDGWISEGELAECGLCWQCHHDNCDTENKESDCYEGDENE